MSWFTQLVTERRKHTFHQTREIFPTFVYTFTILVYIFGNTSNYILYTFKYKSLF